MKKAKTILISAVLTIIAFGAITYTSCTKDPCSGVTCLNGGACSGGNCLCPAGYVGADCGTLATTTVQYNNDTYTPVTLVAGGTSYNIPVGSSVSFNATYGTTIAATATTAGSGGLTITMDETENFPASGTLVVGVDIPVGYFYLLVQNNALNYYINQVDVNIGLTDVTATSVSIPNNGQIYGVGYFDANSNTGVEVFASGTGGSSTSTVNPIPLPFTSNQAYTFVFN